MSHKTMIDGVAYEISGGKTLVNGTAYSIKNGKTLVDGTAYEVGFAKPLVTVTLEADLPTGYNTAEFAISYSTKDEPYGSISSAGIYEIEMGTELIFYIYTASGKSGTIYLNDETVASGSDKDTVSYVYTLTGNVSVRGQAVPIGGMFYITET